ncbi:MAG TPA: hypothetical protein ENK04_07245 [Gammaproteobacteria bacterium]|nr:hypothetical protein [Gammaproteobacteria bacterium]
MNNDILKVPKKLHRVTLWVHPEGRVIGSIYLRTQSPNHAGGEQPLEALNACKNFLVFNRNEPEELRFYNIKSVIRIEYDATEDDETADNHTINNPMHCHLQLMDGSCIDGSIHESLPPNHARLLDYLNRSDETFIKIYMEDGLIYLINKSYINHVRVDDIGTAHVETQGAD